MSRRWSLAFLTAVSLCLVALGVPTGAAVAEQIRSRLVLTDPTGDVWAVAEGEDAHWDSAADVPAADVVRAVVRHGRRNLVARMTFANLRRVEPQSYSVTFVTRERYGAVFVQAGPGRWRGRHLLVDEQFGRVKCPGLRHHIDYGTDEVATVLPRSCIGRPAWVRASMTNLIFRGETEDDFPDRGRTVWESGAILFYLAERSGKLLPPTPEARIETLEWVLFQAAHIGPTLGQYWNFAVFADEKLPSVIARFEREARRVFGVLNGRLAGHEHLAGAEYGIADVMTWPWIDAATAKLGFALDAHPHLTRWFEAVGRRPAVRRGLLVPVLPAADGHAA